MFTLKMRLGLLALLCSCAVASQPAHPPKHQAVHASPKQENVKALTEDATSHLRKTPPSKAASTKKQKEKDEEESAISGLVKGLASVPTKGGKVVPGFANKAKHPSVRALHEQEKPVGKAKVSEPKPVAKGEAKSVVKAKPSGAKPVAKAKPVAHQPKVSEPKPVAKEKQEVKSAVPHHPALVARAYPSLIPMPPKRNPSAVSAFSTASMTEEQRAQKVQHAMDISEEATQEIDKEVQEAKKEASEAHRIVHGK